MLTVNLLFSTLIFWLTARLYLESRLPRLEVQAVVIPILLLHAMRHLGLMFLEPGATDPGLPADFAVPAALGDFLAATLALIALPAVVQRSRLAKPLVWIFNLEGSVDLVLAIALATVHDAAPYMGAAYWIPAVWVPALLVTHFIVFRLLLQPWPVRDEGRGTSHRTKVESGTNHVA